MFSLELRSKKRKRRPALSATQLKYQHYEQHGASFLERLTLAIREESWLVRLAALAWTAGPVTYLALQISFWIGYRRLPATELIYYFGAYTLITGTISLGVNLVYRATLYEQQRRAEQVVGDVIGLVPDLIISLRNEALRQVSPEERRLRAALVLLRDPDATGATLYTAVEDLTGCQRLAATVRRIESFRRKGLFSRIEEEGTQLGQAQQQLLHELKGRSAYAAALLAARLGGRAPSKRVGQRRPQGFLKRLIRAVDAHDQERIRLEDAEELLKLLLELFVDRRFPVLRWHLEGDDPLAPVSRELEQARLAYRRQRRQRRLTHYEILRELDEHYEALKLPLPEDEEREEEPDFFPVHMELLHDLPQLDKLLADEKLTSPEDKASLRPLIARLREQTRRIGKLEKRLREAEGRFRQQWQAKKGELAISLAGQRGGIRLRLERGMVVLAHDRKIRLAERLHFYLAGLSTNRERTQILAAADDEEFAPRRPLSPVELKSLALRILGELEQVVDLSQEAVVDSLEALPAINVTSIEFGLSKSTKIGWLRSLVDEIEEQLAPLALRVAERLVRHLDQPLPPTFARELAQRYRLSVRRLCGLAPSPKGARLDDTGPLLLELSEPPS